MSTAEQGARLTRAEAEIRELRKGQEVIFAKLDDLASAMGDVRTALTSLRAASGPSVRDVLGMVWQGAALLGLVAGGILYLASGSNTAELRDLDKRLTRLETVVGMATARARPAPGAWAGN